MNKKIIKLLIIVLILSILTGCATNLYVWNDYSKSKYKMKKNNTSSSKQTYKNSLQSIIHKGESSGKKVPPGIYCELGQIFQQEGATDEAIECFNKEKNLYPEAATFVNLILKQISDNTNVNSEEGEKNE